MVIIKRLGKTFKDISINKLNESFNNDKDKISYLNGWICYCLMIREMERKKLDRNDRINLLYNHRNI